MFCIDFLQLFVIAVSVAGGSTIDLRRGDKYVVELKTAQSAAATGILHPGIFHTRDVTDVLLSKNFQFVYLESECIFFALQ